MGIAGIIQIIVLLLPVILSAIAAHNTPEAIQKATNEELDKAVVSGDTATINTFLHDRLPDTPEGSSFTIKS